MRFFGGHGGAVAASRQAVAVRRQATAARRPLPPQSAIEHGGRSAPCAGVCAARASECRCCERTGRRGAIGRRLGQGRLRDLPGQAPRPRIGRLVAPAVAPPRELAGRLLAAWVTTAHTVSGNSGCATRLSTTEATARMPSGPSVLASQYSASARHRLASSMTDAARAVGHGSDQASRVGTSQSSRCRSKRSPSVSTFVGRCARAGRRTRGSAARSRVPPRLATWPERTVDGGNFGRRRDLERGWVFSAVAAG